MKQKGQYSFGFSVLGLLSSLADFEVGRAGKRQDPVTKPFFKGAEIE